MCGIIGQVNGQEEHLQKGLDALQHRGRDGTKTLRKDNVLFGHTLHAIIDVVPQPFHNKGLFVANCEIYNWEALAKKYNITAKNDAELLFRLLEQTKIVDIPQLVEELDGDYAFAYYRNEYLVLARDSIGVKPLWFNKENLLFASERKAIEAMNYEAEELNPRHVLTFNTVTKSVTDHFRSFFTADKECEHDKQELITNVMNKLEHAFLKRLPKHHVGILFSGGIDSTILAWLCKKHKVPFTCYTAALDSQPIPEDLRFARAVAKDLGFPLKEIVISQEEVAKVLPRIVSLIESSNVVKVGVALPFYFCAELAAKDGIRVMLSGLGSEEIFAGYERHTKARDINKECISGLRKLYERDLYRDDVILMDRTIELRVPFLDKGLVDYAVKIPAKYKLVDGKKKMILREAALAWGILREYALRPKRAAQYGSRFDKAIEKLARDSPSKSAYLRQFYPRPNLRLGCLFSSGKDSTYALFIMQRQNYDVTCLITVLSKNPDSYMYHTPAIEFVKQQAIALELPVLTVNTAGKKEEELVALENALAKAKEQFKLDGIITGAIYSTYQRDRIELACDKLGLKIFSPLWHKSQEEEMRQLINDGFSFVFTKIAADGLNKSWLGKVITLEDVDKLVQLQKRNGINIAGEGGEFESFVVDSPLFKQQLVITDFSVEEEAEHTALMHVNKIQLVPKTRNI